MGLTEDKLGFYDALETNNNPIVVLDDDTPIDIASELVDTVRKNVRANFRRLVNAFCTSRSRLGQCSNKQVLSSGWTDQVS